MVIKRSNNIQNNSFNIRPKKHLGLASFALLTTMVLGGLPFNTQHVHADEATTQNPAQPIVTDETTDKNNELSTKMETVALNSVNDVDTPQHKAAEDKEQPVATALKKVEEESGLKDKIELNHIRMHFEEGLITSPETEGLWLWEDVEKPSNGWPNGAISFKNAKTDEFGKYLDIKTKTSAEKIGWLINKTDGNKVTKDDQFLNINSPKMNEAWITKDLKAYPYKPLKEEKTVRINYFREDGKYDDWALWAWDNVNKKMEDFPNGAISFEKTGLSGKYIDFSLKDVKGDLGFLFVNKKTKEQTKDYHFTNRINDSQIFMRAGDDNIYHSPYYDAYQSERLTAAQQTSLNQIDLLFKGLNDQSVEKIKKDLKLTNKSNQSVKIDEVIKNDQTLQLKGNFNIDNGPYTLTYGNTKLVVQPSWKLTDEQYGYDGTLGAELKEDGSATLKVWSPSAQSVKVRLYDKKDANKVIKDFDMKKGERGVWQVDLSGNAVDSNSLEGYFYHYVIKRDGKEVVALDPYAKSLAAWDQTSAKEKVAKAAIVNPAKIGPQLDYAKIDGYEKREDAVIYEVHVRNFTSDPSIKNQLTTPYGTFSAFAEKLDYIKSLGATHIQLLPVMSYYFANEKDREKYEDGWKSKDNNFNWGYDPQSYFALTGMYSSNPDSPNKRIEEFKQLVQAIHDKGMGVILDVVYNHTAQVHLFEDLEPNYYHFMNKDGSSRESFGGGRLGTTHKMSRRILVDSIKYWTDEFKVDGFRFDMMGDHDAESIQKAFDEAKKLNPNVIMLGEGWRTYAGDEVSDRVQAADQDWMKDTNSVGVFADKLRNELKSGFGNEGQPAFLTGGHRNIQMIFDNLTGKPSNFQATAPGDVIQYIEAHDNLTLHDVIAQSIKKDPAKHEDEIHRRIRIGNLMIMTSQGTPFIHSGQEYGATRQIKDPNFKGWVNENDAPYKSTYMTDEQGHPFEYPYFIHDAYDSSDHINHFNWDMVTDGVKHKNQKQTHDFTKGLIHLRRSTDAFRKGSLEAISKDVHLMRAPEIHENDLLMGFVAYDKDGVGYAVIVNADNYDREVSLQGEFLAIGQGSVLVDGTQAGVKKIANPIDVVLANNRVKLKPLTATVIRFNEDKMKKPVPESNSDKKDQAHDQNNQGTPEKPNASDNNTKESDQSGNEQTEPNTNQKGQQTPPKSQAEPNDTNQNNLLNHENNNQHNNQINQSKNQEQQNNQNSSNQTKDGAADTRTRQKNAQTQNKKDAEALQSKDKNQAESKTKKQVTDSKQVTNQVTKESVLPQTGEVAIFSTAALSVLAGLGLAVPTMKKED